MAKGSGVQGLSALVDDVNNLFGAGTMVSFEDDGMEVEVIGSGSLSLDIALGGGYPLGRIVEIYGPESSGKTTLTLHAVKEVQEAGSAALFLDMENAFDPSYATSLGLDLSRDKFILSQPDCGEDAFTILEKAVLNDSIGICVVDSVAVMTPRAEMEGEFGESKMGLQARMMSQGFRKLVGSIKKSNTLVIFINQTRDKIGVMFGSPETTTGGNALKFYASQRLRVGRKAGNKDKSGELTTNEITVKVIKNKIAPPHRVGNFHIRFGEGIDSTAEAIEFALELDIIEKKGSFYKYNGNNIGQGMEKAREYLIDNPEVYTEIYDLILEQLQ